MTRHGKQVQSVLGGLLWWIVVGRPFYFYSRQKFGHLLIRVLDFLELAGGILEINVKRVRLGCRVSYDGDHCAIRAHERSVFLPSAPRRLRSEFLAVGKNQNVFPIVCGEASNGLADKFLAARKSQYRFIIGLNQFAAWE